MSRPISRPHAFLFVFAAAAIPFAAAAAAAAAAAQDVPVASPSTSPITVTVNGETVAFGPAAQPVQQSGTVLVPLRGVFEKLGANVQFNNASKTIVAIKGPATVRLRLGESQADVSGEVRGLSVPAYAERGATLVPLRFVSEALGAQVRWRADDRSVQITTAATATARPPAAAGAQISQIFHDTPAAGRPLKAGDALTVTLVGTPGGTATFSITGVSAAQNVPMRETAPGTYQGTFTVPAGVNAAHAAVVGQLARGQSRSPLVPAPGAPVVFDAAAPQVSGLSPEENASLPAGRPAVSGTFADPDGGINAASARLSVNDQDVTAQAAISAAGFSYQPPADLPAGKNTAVVTVRDAAGNETRRAWSFVVTAPVATLPAASVPEPPVIDTPQEDARVGAATVTITGHGAAPGARVGVRVAYAGRVLGAIPARGTLTERTVIADAQGRWSVENVRLGAPPGVGRLSFSVSAAILGPAGGNGKKNRAASSPAVVRFRR